MHPPCEMMVDSFLPAMRESVAKLLAAEGFSQGKIAGMLGVTQASVSLYLKSETRSAELLRRLGVSEDKGGLYASLLAEDLKKNPVYAVNTLYSFWSELLGTGSVCAPHRFLNPQLAQCDVCLKVFAGGEARPSDAIDHVSEAVRMVEESQDFVRVMPEVSVNIAFAPEGATSALEIVAVPGRIVKVRGRPRSFMKPEYGASTHVANVLLVAMNRSPSIRASMNLRYDQGMRRAMRRVKLVPLVLDEAKVRSEAEMMQALALALRGSPRDVAAVVDPGAPGLEAGLYLFGKDAVYVAGLGLRIARAYSGET